MRQEGKRKKKMWEIQVNVKLPGVNEEGGRGGGIADIPVQPVWRRQQ